MGRRGLGLTVGITVLGALHFLLPGKEGTAPGASAVARTPPAPSPLWDLAKERPQELDPRAGRVGDRMPDLAFRDLEGREGRLSDFADAPALVICVRDVGCPVSKRQGGRLAALERAMAGRGVAFLHVNASSHNTLEEMRDEVALHGFVGRYAHDPEGRIASELHAETTTETFVLDPARTLRYRGALDDQNGRGTNLEAARRTWLRDALEDVLAGRPVRVAATTSPGCLLGLEPAPLPTGTPTYHDEVARVLQRSCVPCHRDGGPGPFALTSYEEARGRGGMVRFCVREGIMPPWFADDAGLDFENDQRLAERDREALLAWYEAGCPEGDPADAPVPLALPEGWSIREPDLVFEMPEAFDVPAQGVVDLQRFVAEARVPRDLWVSELEVLPSAPEVVHHATVMFRSPPTARPAEERLVDALVPWMRPRAGWEFLFGYLPGKGPRRFEEGVARFLPAGSHIRFEMHYTPNGSAVSERCRLGLVLADAPPELESRSRLLRNRDLFVPAGARDVAFEIAQDLPDGVILRSLTPHMHLIGSAFQVDLELPGANGAASQRRTLLSIPGWDPDWQFSYVFREGPFVPPGARLVATGWFDNTAANPNQPFHPPHDVTDGPQIWDEMLIVAVEWLSPIAAGDPRLSTFTPASGTAVTP